MICPKCKTHVSANESVCPTCKLRLIFKCPRCQSLTRIGSVSCKKCGYIFVKFCPKCKSANFVSADVCRKCKNVFEKRDINAPIIKNTNRYDEKKEIQKNSQKNLPASNPQKQGSSEQIKQNKPFLFYIDFINLVEIFEKYKKDEFKLKVTQNIKTTIKIVFDTQCEFVNSHCIIFKYHHVKSQKLIDKIKQFELEFSKFNEILERTLDAGLTYKFAISTIEEVKRNNNIPPQLKYGQNRDIIISSGVYPKLSSELSIIKLANDVYKVVYIEQKPEFEQSEDEKYDKVKVAEDLDLRMVITKLLKEDNLAIKDVKALVNKEIKKYLTIEKAKEKEIAKEFKKLGREYESCKQKAFELLK